MHVQLSGGERERQGPGWAQRRRFIGWYQANEMGLLLYAMMSRNPRPGGRSETLTWLKAIVGNPVQKHFFLYWVKWSFHPDSSQYIMCLEKGMKKIRPL